MKGSDKKRRTMSATSTLKRQYSVFNGKYELITLLGQGKTSDVHLARDIKNPRKQYAVKIYHEDFIEDHDEIIRLVRKEIEILHCLKHPNVIGIKSHGSDGSIVSIENKKLDNLMYLSMEYIPRGILFD